MPSERCSDGILFSIGQTALQQADKIGIRGNAVLITRIDFNLFFLFDELSIPDYSTLCRYRNRKSRYTRAAYFGLLKVSAQSHLKAMCLNLLKAANRLSAPVAA